MKKIVYFKWLFVICLMFLGISCDGIIVNAVSIRSGDFSYENLEDGTVSITGYYGTDESVVIPSEINGKSVSEIGEYAFSMCNELKTITIPSCVKTIGNCAFGVCQNLETVLLSDGIEIISKGSFGSCEKLKTITIPSSVKTIEEEAFCDCESLESITMPNTDISIDITAFKRCFSLTLYIDSNSKLMKNMISVEKRNFSINCINHPQIIKDEAVPPTCTQKGKTEGSHCSVCDYKVKQETIKATGQHSWDEGVVTFKPSITQEGIKEFTCKVCKKIKEERIPKLPAPTTGSTVTQLDDSYKVTNSAESGTTNATVEYSEPKKSKSTITVPDTVTIDGITYKVTSISKNAFKNNKKIKKVIIGKNITKIEANTFSGCKNLKTITIKSKNIKSVGKNAFKGIHKKAKIKVPASKLKKYKKLMSKKGQKSTVKITK